MSSLNYLGQRKEDLDTPALLIDLEIFEANIERLAHYCRDHQTAWRPHSKAHKCPEIARLLLKAGASGITCAKLSEAEVMVAGGIDDILVANQIVTPNKLKRLAALQHRARVLTTLDNLQVVEPMGAAAEAEGSVIPVLIDVDIGMNRTGVAPGQPVLDLARKITATPGLVLEGVMGYEGHVIDMHPPEAKLRACHQALDMLLESRDLLLGEGVPVTIVSAGGTGTYRITAAYPGITEIQAGGGIFMDNLYRQNCSIEDLDFALTVLATVTSRHPRHIITDTGFKTMSAFHAPPAPLGRDDLEFKSLSAEHGIFAIKEGCEGPQVGECIELVVGYSDSTNVLHDRFFGLRHGRVERVWDILGRGKLT